MSPKSPVRPRRVYKIACESGRRYVIYNASELGNPADHVPDKWYVLPYPALLGVQAGESYDTAADAEQAALLMDALKLDSSPQTPLVSPPG